MTVLGASKTETPTTAQRIVASQAKCCLTTPIAPPTSDELLARALTKVIAVHVSIFHSALITLTFLAIRIVVETGRTLVTLEARKALLTVTLTRNIVTTLTNGTGSVTLTVPATLLVLPSPAVSNAVAALDTI